ncbi:MAG TPA: aldose epimerase family protein, partial [Chitinophagaceae bacterium]|nr:aldose epimerase family protein [Chitinophagaceae bacterium]
PGNLHVGVKYSLTATIELRIDYSATTDKSTPINLTNHCYFNLSAGSDPNILNHELMLNAKQFTEVNDKLIPTGKLIDVKGTPMDFIIPKKIGRDIGELKGGYDHNWVLVKHSNYPELAATVYHAPSGRFMEVYTTEPGLQMYTGNFLDSSLIGRNGTRYGQHAALCLEAQHFPDSPNEPSFPNTILKPGETYHQTTIYKFSVK